MGRQTPDQCQPIGLYVAIGRTRVGASTRNPVRFCTLSTSVASAPSRLRFLFLLARWIAGSEIRLACHRLACRIVCLNESLATSSSPSLSLGDELTRYSKSLFALVEYMSRVAPCTQFSLCFL